MRLETEYNYGNSQIFAQHDGSFNAKRYFYLHDRLGSVRQVIDTMGNVVNHYTYRPFGELYPAPDFEQTVNNPFKFTGQYYDFEINEYYLRARVYDPHIGRFTARDPVRGEFKEPLTLHRYLYCLSNPVNRLDLRGEFSFPEILMTSAINATLGGLFRGIIQGAFDAAEGKSFWKGFFKGGAKGAAFGAVSGGLASFSAQGFMWMFVKDAAKMSIGTGILISGAGGSLGGAGAGALEGAWDVIFSDAAFHTISDRAIGGLFGGFLGGMATGATRFPGLELGVDQLAQEVVELFMFLNRF
jgi:RHS repeat-associated protein